MNRTASDGKLGEGLGSRLGLTTVTIYSHQCGHEVPNVQTGSQFTIRKLCISWVLYRNCMYISDVISFALQSACIVFEIDDPPPLGDKLLHEFKVQCIMCIHATLIHSAHKTSTS